MSELKIFELVLPVIALIAAGWLVVRLKVLTPSAAKPLTTSFLYLFLPALLVQHLAQQQIRTLFNARFIMATAALMLGIYGILFLIHAVILRRPLDSSALAAFAGSKFNAVVVGLPLLAAAIGRDAIAPVIVNLVLGYFTILPLTLVLLEFAQARRPGRSANLPASLMRAIRHTAADPLVVATLIGLFLAAAHLTLPPWIQETLSTLGAAAIAVPLVAVGMTINAAVFKENRGEIIWMSAARVVAGPLLAVLAARLFALPPALSIALVISFGLPTAKMAFALAEDHGVYVSPMAGIVTLTTGLMLVTYPAGIWLCERLWPGVIARHAG